MEKLRYSAKAEKVCKYFLLTALLSFLGWVFEVTYVYLYAGRYKDAGFMSLPFCPIYGCTLLAVYFVGGTPDEPRGVFKNLPNFLRWIGYWALAFLAPTIAELFIGFAFDKAFGLRLWNYQGQRYNYNGYVALFVSLQWSALIVLVMKYIFPYLKRAVFSFPKKQTIPLTVFLFIIGIADVAYNLIKV